MSRCPRSPPPQVEVPKGHRTVDCLVVMFGHPHRPRGSQNNGQGFSETDCLYLPSHA